LSLLEDSVVVAYEGKKIDEDLPEYGGVDTDIGGEGIRVAEPFDSGPYLFRSYDHWGSNERSIVERNPGVAHCLPIWQVARATTAAPFYFDPIDIQNRKYGDGGFGKNNPVIELFSEVKTMHGHNADTVSMILSVGTGTGGFKIKQYRSGTVGKYMGYLKAVKQIASASEDQHQIMLQTKPSKLEYHRLNVKASSGLAKMKLDEWKGKDGIKTLDKMKRLTNEYLEDTDVKKEIEEIADVLVHARRQRAEPARNPRWELFATGVQYRCTYKECWKSQKLRTSSDNLKRHLVYAHEVGEEELKKLIEKGKCYF
jgi:hypothetical protein